MPPNKKSKPAPRAAMAAPDAAKSYNHPEARLASSPEVGTQDSFRATKSSKYYRQDWSPAPGLQWDTPVAKVCERAKDLPRVVENVIANAAQGDRAAANRGRRAAAELRRMQQPFLAA
jgi:hypothetical protein